jgi:phosphoribosylformylglycinamidine cyclo-ligase
MVGDVLNLALPKEFKVKFMSQIANGFARVIDLYRRYGFSIKFLGGETADLPYQVRTGVFDVAVAAWEKKKNIIKGDVRPGDLIFGFPSDGQAAWETEWNSGIMSNGLTTARQCTMHHEYNSKYPNLRGDTYFYNGHYRYDDKPKILGGMTVNDALLSPTRHWAIVIKQIINCLEEVGALSMLHGITVNTGGGATKIKHLGKGGVTFIKDMIVSPPFFHFIQEASQETWKNMFKNFNCGIGIDVVGENNPIFIEALKQAALKCALPLYRLGSCEKSHDPEKNTVILNSQFGSWTYN